MDLYLMAAAQRDRVGDVRMAGLRRQHREFERIERLERDLRRARTRLSVAETTSRPSHALGRPADSSWAKS
jgi:hypothetical protein